MTVVRDLMAFGALTVQQDEALSHLVGRLRRIGHEGYPVLDADGQVVGLLTARDMNRAAENGLEHLSVRDVMMAGAVTATPQTPLSELLRHMVESGWGQIPVMQHNALIGIVTRTDVIRHYAELENTRRRHVTHDEVAAVLGTPAADLIAFIAREATQQGKSISMVGGIVRDLLLKRPNDDIDFVMEAPAIAFVGGLVERYGGKLEKHEAFGTAKWTLDETAAGHIGHALHDLPATIDVVTARHEFYEEPAVLPTVYNSGIRLDLRRRDFTINALAVKLRAEGASGTVIDLFGGLDDLNGKLVRVLHSLSFADDPTRIFRAVRYAHRLGFELEPRTADLIQTALPMLKRITGERVRNEITRLLHEPNPADGLLWLQRVGVLQAVHPAFVLQVDLVQRAFLNLDDTPPAPPEHADDFRWLLLATSMDAEYVEQVTARLLFNKSTAEGMKAAALLTEYPDDYLSGKPSTITFKLEKLPLDAVLATWIVLPEERTTLAQYVNEWRHVRIVTDGNTLKKMGLPPGPRYKIILDGLRARRINGEIQTDEQETAALRALIESE